jgi:hypothetical protein
VGVVSVQFKLDGTNLGAEDMTSPYSNSWDTTTASNGSHTLMTLARDAAGNQTTSTAISVTVANNQAPAVNAGPDQTATLVAGVTLTGTATDDGLPSGILTVQWSMVSGPAPVMFSASQSTTTDVTFTMAGTYVLRLTASDSQLTSTDDVTITVTPF